MNMQSNLIIFFILSALCGLATSIRWLSLASVAAIPNQDTCDSLLGLVKRQKRICRKNVEVMDPVINGATTAISECQFQFRNRRWNCSTVDTVSIFGNVLNAGTREAGFVHAIAAAGVAHAVTKACSTGNLKKCGCDRSVRGKTAEGFEWAGCSDNIAYGGAFCRTFVDARERTKSQKKSSGRALMNLHNNEAGRKIIETNMRRVCKCHGVSGSCELKTCWRAMPSFREIGEKLKQKFDGATEVQQKRMGSRRILLPQNQQYKPHSDEDLVYLEASPDFCEFDPKTGSLGTQGRKCSKDSKAIDGCELMCCGRGAVAKKRKIVERCMCKFHWCCYVKCKECTREVEEYYCR